MNISTLASKTFWHYRLRNGAIALGMAIGMAVITGALVTGDSVRQGLQNLVKVRLGNVDLAVSSGDRYLTDSLAFRLSDRLQVPATPVLQLECSASAGDGAIRLSKIQIFGIDQHFRNVVGPATFTFPANKNTVVISDNLAARLNVHVGDEILLRISKTGLIPMDAPFVSDAGNKISIRVTVGNIAGNELHGRFSLRNTQTAPFNVFIDKDNLQHLTGLPSLSNRILIAGNKAIKAEQVEQALQTERTLEDVGLKLSKHPLSGDWILQSHRMFFDPPTFNALASVPSVKTQWFSYFVNEFRTNGHTSPYSFVSTLPGDHVQAGEVFINQWLADDLKARIGDSVTLSYYTVGPLRSLTVKNIRLKISNIISMNDPLSDRWLMPEIPGLSDAGNCRDWETSVPIDLSAIKDKDEQYWNQYRGTPKAYLNLDQAAELWQNQFGKFTQIRFPASSDPKTITSSLLSHLRPSDTGIQVYECAKEGRTAASSGTDFSGLFLGLSCFLIAGGILLTILLIRLALDGRLSQIGTLRAVGWTNKQIRKVLFRENVWTTILGTGIGLGITIVYTILIFKALNSVWNNIVLTDSLRPVFHPITLALGMLINMIVSTGTVWLLLHRFFKRRPAELIRKMPAVNGHHYKRLFWFLSILILLGALGLLIYGLMGSPSIGPLYFFMAGTLMLAGFLLAITGRIRYYKPVPDRPFTARSLIYNNLYRNRSRSLSVIFLFAIGIFLVISIGASRKTESSGLSAGTGGFQFYMETTVPVPDNLNDPGVRLKYSLAAPAAFVQMKKLEGDDASCLNLNRVTHPPLLGVPADAFTRRFLFVTKTDKQYEADPWKLLEQPVPKGVVPAIADQTVIQWGLGLAIGDSLIYRSEAGDTVKVVLVGGLANSVFQGNLLIASELLSRYWPSVGGTTIALLSADPSEQDRVQSELLDVFRDYGIELKPAATRLAEFNSIENTYLSIFLVMGALAMLLGTIGLSIILVRNLQERQSEIAILCSTGFSRGKILRLLIREYSALLIVATLAGGLSSLICVLPGLLKTVGGISPLFLFLILAALLINGWAWIVFLGWHAVKKQGIVQSLRTE